MSSLVAANHPKSAQSSDFCSRVESRLEFVFQSFCECRHENVFSMRQKNICTDTTHIAHHTHHRQHQHWERDKRTANLCNTSVSLAIDWHKDSLSFWAEVKVDYCVDCVETNDTNTRRHSYDHWYRNIGNHSFKVIHPMVTRNALARITWSNQVLWPSLASIASLKALTITPNDNRMNGSLFLINPDWACPWWEM